jgi:predicted alpha/beta-hydrolase family hydrolase
MLSTMTDILFDGPKGAPLTLILAHGAGAPMDSPFMTVFAEGLGARGIRTARFEFPYMAIRRVTGKNGGKKRPPDRQPILLQTWRRVIAQVIAQVIVEVGGRPLAIGGGSAGNRRLGLFELSLSSRRQARPPPHGASGGTRPAQPDRAGRT